MHSSLTRTQAACARSETAGWKSFTSSTRQDSHAPDSRPCPAAASRLAPVALLDEVVDQFARGVVHLDVECLDTTRKVVERHHGGDGHEQTKRGGDESF